MKSQLTMWLHILLVMLLCVAPKHALTAAYTVNSTADGADVSAVDFLCNTGNTVGPSPECTLRAAIEQSNQNPDADTILFNIPITDPGRNATTGVFSIRPATSLPRIIGNVSISAHTQPGASLSTSIPPVLSEHVLLIELDGSQVLDNSRKAFEAQIVVLGGIGNITIRGFVINSWVTGINAQFTNNQVIRDNYFGTDASGLVAKGSAQSAVVIGTNVTDVQVFGNLVVGGAVPEFNSKVAIWVGFPGTSGGSNHIIRSNYIGVDVTGNTTLGVTFSHGIDVFNAQNISIGGAGAGEGNVIGGNTRGIRLREATNNTIVGNHIGVGVDGASAVGNIEGILLDFFNISGATDNQIGGLSSGEGNIIANNQNNQDNGIVILSVQPVVGNSILSNSIYNNGLMGFQSGIKLGANARDQDPGDADTGINNAQNYPEITNVRPDIGRNVTIIGRLESSTFTEYKIQFFASQVCSGLGHGPGQTLLFTHTATTDNLTGVTLFSIPVLLPTGQNIITATATDPAGNTSEFSDCFDTSVSQSSPGEVGLSQTTYSVQEGDSTPMGDGRLVAVTRQNGTDGRIQISYATDNTPLGAIAGFDYTPLFGDLIFEDGEISKTFFVPVIDDAELESAETFDVFLSNPLDVTVPGSPVADTSLLDANRTTATVTIIDNEIDVEISDSVSPNSDQTIPFPLTFPGDTATATVTITSSSSFDIRVDPITVVDQTQPFAISADGCSSTILETSSPSCSFDVLFQPTVIGPFQTIVRIPIEGQNFDIAVSGGASINIALSLTKTVDLPVAGPGDNVTFTITVTNDGPANAAGVEVTDRLPAGLSFVAATANPAAAYDPVTGVWTVGLLSSTAPGNIATMTLEAQVDMGVNEAIIMNQASITMTQPADPDTTDNTASATVGVGGADLEITSVSPNTTFASGQLCFREPIDCPSGLEGDPVSFTTGITNNGPQGVSNVRMEFDEPGLLRFTSASVPCVAISNSRYSCDLSVIPGADPLNPGESVELILRTVVVSVPGRFTSLTAEVKASTFDPNPDNNELQSESVFIAATGGRDNCFVATAAYGTPWQARVVTLRQFRDQWLLTNAPGRAFVQWYYANSPPIADWIADRDWARAMVRGVLTPIVIAIENPGKACMLIFATGGLLVLWWRRRPARSQVR